MKSNLSAPEEKTIGIVGLGRIGLPVAEKYLKTGYRVFALDKSAERCREFEALGGTVMADPAGLAEHTDLILILVLNDQQVIEVIEGDRGLLGSGKGINVVCMSTINRSNLERLAYACLNAGMGFVDCPFTGGAARVPEGNLTLIAAGVPELVDSLKKDLEVIGNITYAGRNPGQGQAIKHCNQLLVGATHAATMEVITLARRLGLDAGLACEVIGKGIAGSEYFRLLSDAVLLKKPSPGGLGQMCKDVSIVQNTAKEAGFSARVAAAAASYFKEAEIKGMQEEEGADLIKIVELSDFAPS